MKRWTASTLFLLIALFLGATLTHTANANDAEIKALLDEIADLESKHNSLAKSKNKAESERDAETEKLNYISASIANTDRYIASAKKAYDAAENDEERADWASVIEDLEDYRQSQVYQYNSVAYTIQLLASKIDNLNADIAKVKKEITIAYARLFELLND